MVFTAGLCLLLAAGSAIAAPVIERRGNIPEPVSVATAKSYLNSITVAAESNVPAYDRDLFPHWSTVSGACNAREYVLKRDGVNVQTDSACASTSGSWYSDYDGATWTAASDVDIDHVVPLVRQPCFSELDFTDFFVQKEAWISGARSWTTAQRQAFANDVTRPQLLAVTDNVNQAKSDQDLAEWLPPLVGYQCKYVRAYVQVKYYYGLTMDSAEKAAAADVLNNVC